MDRQNFIELISVPFQAGESRLFAITGQYFELIDATTPVDVVLSDAFGAQRGVMRQAEASFNLKNTEFSTVQLTSAAAQMVRFAYGTGEAGTRRSAGSVNIANVPTVALQAGDMSTLRRPESYTGVYTSSVMLAANTPEVVFSPAANVNGAIVYAAQSVNYATLGNMESYLAKASAPANIIDGVPIVVSQANVINSSNTNVISYTKLDRDVFVPPGLGLYFIASAAMSSAAGSVRFCRYRLL